MFYGCLEKKQWKGVVDIWGFKPVHRFMPLFEQYHLYFPLRVSDSDGPIYFWCYRWAYDPGLANQNTITQIGPIRARANPGTFTTTIGKENFFDWNSLKNKIQTKPIFGYLFFPGEEHSWKKDKTEKNSQEMKEDKFLIQKIVDALTLMLESNYA